MSAKFGRCDTGSDPMTMSQNGSSISLSGWLVGSSLNDLKARWQQLQGLIDNVDEPVVPVTCSHDSSLDGYYLPDSVSVSPVPGAGYVGAARVQYSISLTKVVGFSNPIIETIVQSVVRTNAHAITVPPPIVAWFTGATPTQDVDLRGGITVAASLSRFTSDGQTAMPQTCYTATAPLATTQFRVFHQPAYYYYGAARVEILYGATWYPVTGRNIPATAIWRVSNGVVRLTSAQAATQGTIESWDNTAVAWESVDVSHWTNGSRGPSIGFGDGTKQATISILRNSPEQVTVRVCSADLDFTYTLQRGARFVAAAWTSKTALKYGAGHYTATAATAITGGIRATSNNAAGNRLVFAMPVAQTTDLVNGATNASVAATSGVVIFGVEVGGSGAGSGDAAADLVNQFIGATSWRQRVVPR